jgi:DeoR family transcriptional regulator of aga operon
MQARCHELGIRLEVIDSSHDLATELEQVNRVIGRTAAQFVEEDDTIIIDAGPGAADLATSLRSRQGLTVITNSLDVFNQLNDAPGIRLIVSGGLYRIENRCLIGQAAEETFRGLRASKAFLTCTGASLSFGLSTNSTSEAGVKQAVLSAARQVILLADHTKIGAEALVRIAPLDSIHRLVTDAGISPHDRESLTRRGLEVIIADDQERR